MATHSSILAWKIAWIEAARLYWNKQALWASQGVVQLHLQSCFHQNPRTPKPQLSSGHLFSLFTTFICCDDTDMTKGRFTCSLLCVKTEQEDCTALDSQRKDKTRVTASLEMKGGNDSSTWKWQKTEKNAWQHSSSKQWTCICCSSVAHHASLWDIYCTALNINTSTQPSGVFCFGFFLRRMILFTKQETEHDQVLFKSYYYVHLCLLDRMIQSCRNLSGLPSFHAQQGPKQISLWSWFSCSVGSDSYDPMDCIPAGFSVHGILQVNTGVGLPLLQGIFPTQGSNPQISYQILMVASRHELFNKQ